MYVFLLSKGLVRLAANTIIQRNLRRKLGPNPGIDLQHHAFKEANITPKVEELDQVLEDSESDFHGAHTSYNEYLLQKENENDFKRKQIIKQKYFKENMPNLLTWSEKEQIRLLHGSDPDEWSYERIAECFPVTAAVVKKLVSYPWKPASEDRIKRHDNSTMRNWNDLMSGQLDLPEELKQHFLKFSNRSISPKQTVEKKENIRQIIGEFESIVNEKNDSRNEDNLMLSENVTNVGFVKTKKITYEQFKESLPDDLLAHANSVESKIDNSGLKDIQLESIEINNKNNLQSFKEIPQKLKPYPEFIKIPKTVYIKGATYKVNDCYYDSDGTFLYRVPGMD